MRRVAFEQASGTIETRIGHALARLALAGRHLLGRTAGRAALSPIQALILEELSHQGPAAMSALAHRLGVTAPTVSDSVGALERRGLVVRRAVPEDARRVAVHLTARGSRVARRQSAWRARLADLVASLSDEDKATFFDVLLRILAALVLRGIVREARMCPTCVHFRPHAHPDAARPHHCALVDLPLSAAHLRVECPDHAQVSAAALRRRLAALAPPGS